MVNVFKIASSGSGESLAVDHCFCVFSTEVSSLISFSRHVSISDHMNHLLPQRDAQESYKVGKGFLGSWVVRAIQPLGPSGKLERGTTSMQWTQAKAFSYRNMDCHRIDCNHNIRGTGWREWGFLKSKCIMCSIYELCFMRKRKNVVVWGYSTNLAAFTGLRWVELLLTNHFPPSVQSKSDSIFEETAHFLNPPVGGFVIAKFAQSKFGDGIFRYYCWTETTGYPEHFSGFKSAQMKEKASE